MVLGKEVIFNELQKMHSPLYKTFPNCDIRKIRKDYKNMFTEDDCISSDLNYYWMHTAGPLSYVLNKNEEKITFQQLRWLRILFFEWFPQYRFLETEIVKYPILHRDFMNYEKARKLLLYYLTE
ncbi:hypothetical protein IEE_02691 [Bacillus cereus BAG5X1-1]|uniref:YxiJ-like protein n=1 Tax=Bacillus cereus BAG5X1-1 TaxID=1053189 RepID=J8A7D8_BACCE|nr:YxiJ-like family protein [Bacillus cereus]EJQ44501.1 hypothetical protein IEE_02691 [Bacillus cereus BAG5X1-1]PGY11539.1 hypothetical protein COE23_19785 [Bacillus cereus]